MLISEDDRVVSEASIASATSRTWSDVEAGRSDDRRRLTGVLTGGRSGKDRL